MNLLTFDLNLLRVLDALLREGTTVRAGARLGLSQPAVSAALGRLRHALDDPLFVRHGQRLQPTARARSLELPLRDILDRLEALLAGPDRFDPATATESFSISGSDFFAELLMPALAHRLSVEAPGVRAQLVDLVPHDYVATIERHEIDMALIPRTRFPEWADHEILFRSSFAVIARDGHPDADLAAVPEDGVVPIDVFCRLGHVLFSPEGRLSAMGDAALASVGRSRRVVMTLPVFSGVCRAVAGSNYIALIPRQLARAVAPQMGLSVYVPPIPVEPALICMVWHKRVTNAPAHRWFRSLVRDILSSLDEGDRGDRQSPG